MHLSAFSAYHENCAEIKELKFEDASTDRKFSYVTLMEEVRPIVITLAQACLPQASADFFSDPFATLICAYVLLP